MDSAQISAAAAATAAPPVGRSLPLAPRHLVDLFLHPGRFFLSGLHLGHLPSVLLVGLVCGMASTLDRIERTMIRVDLGAARPGADALGGAILESWLPLWTLVTLVGAISGLVLWFVGGWWYRVRLGWAGARNPDPGRARHVYIYASFVYAAPMILLLAVQTTLFANYVEAWNAESLWITAFLVLPFWSVLVSYRGARTLFDLDPGRARLWFAALPAAVYLVAMGAVATAYATLTGG
jgi:hypothetical protein